MSERLVSSPDALVVGGADLHAAQALFRKRGRSPAGAILPWDHDVELLVRELWRGVAHLPVMLLANAESPSVEWARRLGVVLARQPSVALVRCFVAAAHARTAHLHHELRRFADLSRLSHYEAELAWRWVLGQQRERELMSTLSISKATLTERRRSVLTKTGAVDARELVSWVLHPR